MNRNRFPKIPSKKRAELSLTCRSLIGRRIKVVSSLNPKQLGIEGVLVYESAKLFHVHANGKVKRLYKNTITFQTDYENQTVNINGAALLGTLTQRIKKIR